MTKPSEATCQTCCFWKRDSRPRHDEALELRSYRPCALGTGRQFVGSRTLDATSKTAPDSRCELHRPQQEMA